MNTLTPEMHRESNFSELYDAIERRLKENPTDATSERTKDAKSAEGSTGSGEKVSATNGSVAVGGLNIGGDVTGNIAIGNNNEVNKKK